MRLLQLSTGADELIDLHPNMTVVRGLDQVRHEKLLAAVRGLAAGRGVGSGLLEAHGVLFELDDTLLGLVGIESDGIDPIVAPTDLPLQPLTVDARELRMREQAFAELLQRISAQAERKSQARGAVVAANSALAAARQAVDELAANTEERIARADELAAEVDRLAERQRALDDELAARTPEADAAARELSTAEAQAADARRQAEAAAEQLRSLREELARLAAARDPYTVAAVDEAEAELVRVEAEVAAERAGTSVEEPDGPAQDDPDPAVRAAEIDERLRQLEHLAHALSVRGAEAVEAALAALTSADDDERIPSYEGAQLADDLAALVAQIDAQRPQVTVEDATAGRERLDAARQTLLEAEQAARSLSLDPAEVARLEAAHEALLDAIDRADARFATNRTRARVDELRAEQQVILDQLGFGSYSDYMMGNSVLTADPAKAAALEAARVELHAAEEDWRRIEQHTAEALAHAAFLDRRRAMYDDARRLLGELPPGDAAVVAALRDLRVPVVPEAQLAAELREALGEVGLDLADEDVDTEDLVMVAEAWLAEAATVDVRAAEYDAERRSLLAELEGLPSGGAGAGAGAAVEPPPDPEIGRVARIEAARTAVAEAEARWAAHEDAEARWDSAQAAVREAEGAAAAASAATDPFDAVIEELRRTAEPLRARVTELETERSEVAQALGQASEDLRVARERLSRTPEMLAEQVAAAEDAEREAVTTLEAESRALAALDAEGQALALDIERLQDIVAAQGTGSATEADELEWYLLARVAAQRALSIAGSLPLVLDDALRGLEADEVDHLLERLERMAEAVQMIIVSEDPLVAAWADAAGPARAAVVHPTHL